ncbi:coiled-coil domain-containing protein 12-like isoform X1 [Montipora capricornis]|uniref:coiled-coil domain-containing protein 12-like isoform X1 n=1 Tax=Montipora capricornis TaxID=246305 RepID=UPI0035F107A3
MAAVESLEDEALKRRERLKALRKKSGLPDQEVDQISNDVNSRGEKRPHDDTSQSLPSTRLIKFRNYTPKDETLKEKKLPNTKPLSVENEVQEHLEKAKAEKVIEEVDLANLAPRKPDWDLKRDVAKKLEKLEKRTQKAIVELIRDKLQQQDLAAAVNAGASQQNYEAE